MILGDRCVFPSLLAPARLVLWSPASPRGAGAKSNEENIVKTIVLSSFCVSILLVVSGCGGADDVVAIGPGKSSSAPPKSDGTALSAATSAPSVTISGFVHAADASPLDGVSICLQAGPIVAMDIAQCATSDMDGSWTLTGMPANEYLTIGLGKEGFVPAIRAIHTESSDIVLPAAEHRLAPIGDAKGLSGAAYDDSTGAVQFFVAGDDSSELPSATLQTDQGKNVAPIYLGTDGTPDIQATGGTAGAFANVTPGFTLLSFQNVPATCKGSDLYGYPVAMFQEQGAAAIVVPVVAGHVTILAGVDCGAQVGGQ
jgi:hypothetical protein